VTYAVMLFRSHLAVMKLAHQKINCAWLYTAKAVMWHQNSAKEVISLANCLIFVCSI